MLNRRHLITSAAGGAALATLPLAAMAQGKKDTVVLGMTAGIRSADLAET